MKHSREIDELVEENEKLRVEVKELRGSEEKEEERRVGKEAEGMRLKK